MKKNVSACEESILKFFKNFNRVFENDAIDTIVSSEFPRQYALLPLLVKSQLYYNQQ
ncbi:MAG: hypothetical protein MJ180_05975 [Candidatus Gastranaerophilales bacterium]|nr:hypothetical protein [Candidatus Gastranaerophilales bacterium]